MNRVLSPTRWLTTVCASRLPLVVLALCATVVSAQTATKWKITWTDSVSNPIDLQSPGDRAYMPCILYSADWPAESRFRIWYDTASNAGFAYSYSADGLTWSKGTALSGINTSATSSDGKEFAGRPVVLYHKGWPKPFRIYYYGKTDTSAHKLWSAESADGVTFVNNQIALDPEAEGSRLGTFPDGHAVVYLPGRNLTPDDPTAARPFVMYFREKSGQGIAYADSADGFVFTEIPDDPNTTEVTEGLVRLSGLPEGVTTLAAQPTHVLQVAQNDFRMLAFDANTSIKYLASPNGFDWELIEGPVSDVGSVGPDGSWNDERNYHASMAYLGQGRFILARSGRAKTGSQLYRTGVAFGESAFYRSNDIGSWAFYSPMDQWKAEGWETFSSTGNAVDGSVTALLDNGDGTVSVRDRKDSGNFYMVHDAAFSVPFTYEFRARLDDAAGGEGEFSKYMVGAFQTDALHPGGEAWQPAFAMQRFGGWALATDPGADADNSKFQTYTVVCRFDEAARAQLAINPNDGVANVNMAVYDVYLNRDFSAPEVTYHNTGFAGWDSVDLDGRIDIGFPGPAYGQVTVDWIRWGNGVILDTKEPGTDRPVLSILRSIDGLKLSWTGSGTLQSADTLNGTWKDEVGVPNGGTVAATSAQKYFRVRR